MVLLRNSSPSPATPVEGRGRRYGPCSRPGRVVEAAAATAEDIRVPCDRGREAEYPLRKHVQPIAARREEASPLADRCAVVGAGARGIDDHVELSRHLAHMRHAPGNLVEAEGARRRPAGHAPKAKTPTRFASSGR